MPRNRRHKNDRSPTHVTKGEETNTKAAIAQATGERAIRLRLDVQCTFGGFSVDCPWIFCGYSIGVHCLSEWFLKGVWVFDRFAMDFPWHFHGVSLFFGGCSIDVDSMLGGFSVHVCIWMSAGFAVASCGFSMYFQ